MKLAITGASGFLGRELVPELERRGVELLLIGRDPEALHRLFPNCTVSSYSEFEHVARGFDALLHLAVINNDKDFPDPAVFAVNADFAIQICHRAAGIGVKDFVFASSTHALDTDNQSTYARTKRQAVDLLKQVQGINRHVVYLPAVAGKRFAGKLAALNGMPGLVRPLIVTILGALKSTVSPGLIADYLIGLRSDEPMSEVIISNDQDANWLYVFVRNAVDYAFALFVLLIFWWALLAVWAAVRLHSPGPGIFRQLRVGRNQTIFACYKFRTMDVSAPSLGTHEVSASMVTPFGAWLRKTKLDELPQIVNILLNQMSLIGPRPCLPIQEDLISERRLAGVFKVKPGITGLAQVKGIDMSEPARLARMDQQYIKTRGLLLDAKIALATALGRGSGDRVKGT